MPSRPPLLCTRAGRGRQSEGERERGGGSVEVLMDDDIGTRGGSAHCRAVNVRRLLCATAVYTVHASMVSGLSIG